MTVSKFAHKLPREMTPRQRKVDAISGSSKLLNAILKARRNHVA